MSTLDPKLLFTIDGVKAFMLHEGNESELTPSVHGQTLKMILVPTQVSFPISPSPTGYGSVPSLTETDYFLQLQMPGLDLTLPATTPIFSMPPRSYVIPFVSDVPGIFHRFEFLPSVSDELVDTFESIMNQFTSFSIPAETPTTAVETPSENGWRSEKKKSTMGREFTPTSASAAPPPYNPGDYETGEGYAPGTGGGLGVGRLVLVDEKNGQVVGELSENAVVVESSDVKPGSKNPVEVTISSSNKITVRPLKEEFLDMARHPVYNNSSLVQTSAAASRFIVMASDQVVKMIAGGAESFMTRTKATDAPLTFTPATHENFRKLGSVTASAASMSARTAGTAARMAQNLGASLSSRDKNDKGKKKKKGSDSEDDSKAIASGTGKVGYDEHGNPIVADDSYQPGLLNKSLIAFSTIMDGLAYGGTRILQTGATSTTEVVTHRWGAEAGAIADHVAGGVKNVGLVYIDVTGVSRRAVIKSVAKGMVIGRVNNSKVVVRGTDSPPQSTTPASLAAQLQQQEGERITRPSSVASMRLGRTDGARGSTIPSRAQSRSTMPPGVNIPPPPPYPAPTKS